MGFWQRLFNRLKTYTLKDLLEHTQQLLERLWESITHSSGGLFYLLLIPLVLAFALLSAIGLLFKHIYRNFVKFITFIIDGVRIYARQLSEASEDFAKGWDHALEVSFSWAIYLFKKIFDDDVQFETDYKGSYWNLALFVVIGSLRWLFWLAVVVFVLVWLLGSIGSD